MNFKFSVGQEVYHKLWKRNGVVSSRSYIDTVDGSWVAYSVAFNTDDTFRMLDDTSEKWLTEKRHDVE